MEFVSKKIKVRDYTIHYLEWVPLSENVHTMLCVHGYPGSSNDFTRLVRKFEHDCRIISIDLLGSGVSESPEGVHFPVSIHADYLIEMIGLLNLKNIVLVGHSYGGSICQAAAAKSPECFACLVLLASIGSIPHISHRKTKWGFAFADYSMRFPMAYPLMRPIAKYGFKRLGLPLKMVEDEDRFKVFCRTVTNLDFREIGEYASKIACPTLYISSVNDRFVEPAVRRDLEKKIRSFQYAEFQGGSHFIQHTHSAKVEKKIRKFLDQVNGQ